FVLQFHLCWQLTVFLSRVTSPYFVFTLNNGWPYSTSSPSSTSTSTISPETSASISLNNFIASTIQTTESFVTELPFITKGSFPGDGALYSVPTIGDTIS